MKIILTVHQFLPEYSTGTELIAYHLALELRKLGHEIIIVSGHSESSGDGSVRVKVYDYDAFPVHEVRHTGEWRCPGTGAAGEVGKRQGDFALEYDNPQLRGWFADFLRRQRPDMVHCIHLARLSASLIDACKELRIPCIFTATDFWAVCPMILLRLPDGSMCPGPDADGENCVRHIHQAAEAGQVTAPLFFNRTQSAGLLLARVSSAAAGRIHRPLPEVRARVAFIRDRFQSLARILAPSHIVRDRLAAQGFPAERIVCLPYGIHVPPGPARGKSPRGEPLRVGFVGQIAEHKGCHVLIEAVKLLPPDLPIRVRFHGELAYNPAYVARLRKLAEAVEARVEFAGVFNHQDVGAVLGDLDVIVCPSLWYENTPLVIYEALAAGVPVVATDLPGLSEAVQPEVNGLLFPLGDAPALAAILRRLAGDRDLLAKLAANTQPPLSTADHAARVAEIYRAVIAEATANPQASETRPPVPAPPAPTAGGRRVALQDLSPTQELQPLGEAQRWRATGTNPRFTAPCRMPPGWLYLVLDLETTEHAGPATLFLDTGAGFTETACLKLGTPVGGRLRIDLHCPNPHPVRALGLQPQTSPGDFTLHEFHVQHLSRLRFLARAGRNLLCRRWAGRSLMLSLFKAAGYLLRRGPRGLADKLASGMLTPTPSQATAYERWCAAHRLTPPHRAALENQARALTDGPLFSVLLPVLEASPESLRQTLDSLRRQIYTRWELCAVVADAPAPLRATLAELAAGEARLRIIDHPGARDGTAACNAALAAATGDFFSLLDPGDQLAEPALLAVARELSAHNQTDILYADQDQLLPDGTRAGPIFKPGFSPEFLLAGDYVGRPVFYRTDLARHLDPGGGGEVFRTLCQEAREYDLLLRASRACGPARIRRIPEVLYHQFAGTPAALKPAAQPAAYADARRALQEHLHEAYPGYPATLETGSPADPHRVRFTLRSRPLVSIIIPSRCRPVQSPGGAGYLVERCIASVLEKSTYHNLEIFAVDRHEMPPELAARLAARGVQHLTYDFDFNWSRVNNFAAARAAGEHLLFLNDDIEVISPDWIESLLEYSQLPQIGAVGAKLLWPNRTIQHAGVMIQKRIPNHAFVGCPENVHTGYYSALVPRNMIAVTGACLMTRADVFHAPAVGEFNEDFPLAYNDVDYCLKVWHAGKRVVFTPYAALFHLESATRSPLVTPAEMRLLTARWPAFTADDPFYNPNLSMIHMDYRVADPECG